MENKEIINNLNFNKAIDLSFFSFMDKVKFLNSNVSTSSFIYSYEFKRRYLVKDFSTGNFEMTNYLNGIKILKI